MPSIAYMNQSAPFWDFVASLENQGGSHPFFANRGNNRDESSGDEAQGSFFPWGGPWAGPWGGPHRGFGSRHGHGPHGHPHHRRGPPPPEGEHPPPPPEGEREAGMEGVEDEKTAPPEYEGPAQEQRGPHDRRGRCGRGRGMHGRGGPHGHHGRGSFGGPPFGGPFNLGGLANAFQSQFFGDNNAESRGVGNEAGDWKPLIDVFDTPSGFVVHASLPGAKKEDVGVNWDAEKSELSIAGVIYRPGDEEFLKTIAMEERKVGAFERKVRLGSRANPAQIDAEGITAKLEDGILRVEVPKMEGDWAEIKKVEIE